MSSLVVFLLAVMLTFGSIAVAFGPRLRRSFSGTGGRAVPAARTTNSSQRESARTRASVPDARRTPDAPENVTEAWRELDTMANVTEAPRELDAMANVAEAPREFCANVAGTLQAPDALANTTEALQKRDALNSPSTLRIAAAPRHADSLVKLEKSESADMSGRIVTRGSANPSENPDAQKNVATAGSARVPPAAPVERVEILSHLHAFALGSTPCTAPASSQHAAVANTIAAKIKIVSTNPRYAPRRPRLLPQLLCAVNDDDTTRRELAAIISRDPALVGSLLKLANSAFYRVSEQPVESVERAVAVLGTEGIRSLVAAAVMQPVLRKAAGRSSDFVETIWEQTYRAAAGAEAHAAFIEKTDRFAGQLLGLLTGLGTIVVYRLALDRFAARRLSPDAAVIQAAIEAHAADAALRIAASWGVSDRILQALEEAQSQRAEANITPLARSLRFGSMIGALAVLCANGLIDDDAAAATVRAASASKAHAERIWSRLRT